MMAKNSKKALRRERPTAAAQRVKRRGQRDLNKVLNAPIKRWPIDQPLPEGEYSMVMVPADEFRQLQAAAQSASMELQGTVAGSRIPNDARHQVLETAASIVTGHDEDYGTPFQGMSRQADLFNAWMRVRESAGSPGTTPFLAHDMAILEILIKIRRLAQSPDHFDSWTDIAGYAAIGAAVTAAQKK